MNTEDVGSVESALPKAGDSFDLERVVDESLMTPRYGKEDINVLASPAVVYLMELASFSLVEKNLPGGFTSVGAALEFYHQRPSFEGDRVMTTATVREVQGRTVELFVESFVDGKRVAHAKHNRSVLRSDKLSPIHRGVNEKAQVGDRRS